MAKAGRYNVIMRNGRKIIERHQMINYEMALDLADSLREKYPYYSVEFKDTTPFSWK